MRRVAVEAFGKLAEAAFVQQFLCAAEITFRRRDRFRRKFPRAGERFAERRQRPSPRRAVVIRRLPARVLVAFVARPIWFGGIVEHMTVAVNGEWNRSEGRAEGGRGG